jgi:hypothetical protein
MKAYIPCCDESLPVIRVGSYLFNKFWPKLEVNYIGFKKPDFDLYSKNHIFHSIAPSQEGGASKWSKYIYDFMKDIEDDLVIFLIDDYWLCKEPIIDMINIAQEIMQNNDSIGRFDLTFDSQVEKTIVSTSEHGKYSIGSRHSMSMYRISTQPSIWKKDYLLDILKNERSPWEFELNGTDYAKIKYPDKYETVAFYDEDMINYPIRTVAKGAVSRFNPNKYNVLGMPFTTIKDLVSKGFLKESNLIWGQWNGKVPSFNELGGYSFHPRLLDYHESSKTHFKEYYCVYNENK